MSHKLRAIATIAALALVLSCFVLVEAAHAGQSNALCKAQQSERVTIAPSFVLDACFDGDYLYLKNSTDTPLNVTTSGTNAPSVYNPGGVPPIPSVLLMLGHASELGLIAPSYGARIPIGTQAADITVSTTPYARDFALATFLDRYAPVPDEEGVAKALVGYGDELWAAWTAFHTCLDQSRGYWTDVACTARASEDVSFAQGRFLAAFATGTVKIGKYKVALKTLFAFLQSVAWERADYNSAQTVAKSTMTLHFDGTAGGISTPPTPPPGTSDPDPTYDPTLVSPASAPAGRAKEFAMPNGCPPTSNDKSVIYAKLFDSAGEWVASSGRGLNEGGVLPGGHFYYPVDATRPPGDYTVQIYCSSGYDSAYAYRTFAPVPIIVSGAAPVMAVSPTQGASGDKFSVTPNEPCPSKAADQEVAIQISRGSSMTDVYDSATTSAGGNWSYQGLFVQSSDPDVVITATCTYRDGDPDAIQQEYVPVTVHMTDVATPATTK